MRVVFFGTQEWAAEFLKALIADPAFEVVGIVTQPDVPLGRKKILTPPPTKNVALEHNIAVFQPTKLKDPTFLKTIEDLRPDLGVVIAYGRILPQRIIDLPKLGIVNVHPSLLPKWRGPSPVQAAIANGDTSSGLSIMKIDHEMDHGPILEQLEMPFAPDETFSSFMERVVAQGVPVFLRALHGYAEGSITPKEQDHAQATFCKLLAKEDGLINWHDSAEVIERKIRAYNPWPGTFTKNLKIFAAHVTDERLEPGKVKINDNQLLVGTSSAALELLEVQPAGGKRMPAADFLRGRRDLEL